jgi:hypothetical protein
MKMLSKKIFLVLKSILFISLFLLLNSNIQAQYKNIWMSAGSLHNWYSEIGSELEEGFILRQQYGMQWPAFYRYQDMQAARGWWIGCKNFTDENGDYYPYKVVTVGPRNPAFFAAFPVQIEMVGKFEPTVVSVDGITTAGKDVVIDRYDASMPWDRMIINKVATQIGVTMERKIFQFSQQYNDNYIIYEYTFTNTGDTDGDTTTIELPTNVVEDMYTFWTYRNAVNQSVRYVVGNASGWGENTMNDARGNLNAGDPPDPAGENFRCQFSWHGYSATKVISYDNIGAPMWVLGSEALKWNAADDTIGRLGGTQFLGTATLYADQSPTNKVDDPSQPSRTSYLGSDDGLFVAGDNAFNTEQMTTKYLYMSRNGLLPHQKPTHANLIEPSGDFARQTRNPSDGAGQGGYSFNNAYGPYTLNPGESVKIIVVEGAAGMNRADQIKYGRNFKSGTLNAYDKNTLVLTKGKDSLFTTFQRATENFQSGWNIPLPPMPPTTFDINSGGDRISLSWTLNSADPNPPTGFRIYRAIGDYDKDYTLIAELDASARSYDDVNLVRGFNYFYYITCVGSVQSGGPGTPAGRLESNRNYTQSYDPANLQRPAGKTMSEIRIVPNPYIINASSRITFPGTQDEDKIAFYNIPGNCTIKIYTELGELINTIEHSNGSGDAYWYSVTSSGQVIVSGIYIAVITNNTTGENHIAKFAIIR